MKFKATVISNLDGYGEDERDNTVYDVFEIFVKANSLEELEKLKENTEITIDIID